jgi:6-phosphogluconolactonase
VTNSPLKEIIWHFDERRNIAIPGDEKETIAFCCERWLHFADKAIQERGVFNCALSGGSTPKKIFNALAQHKKAIDWSKVRLYFSDERWVPQDHPDSNAFMAWNAGFKELLSPSQFFPMAQGDDPEKAAEAYNRLIENVTFDLIMLGVGEDGHTASLFPKTHALECHNAFVTANFLPEKEVWRITFTYKAIHSGRHINVYALGASKAPIIKEIFTSPYDPIRLPAQKVGTDTHKALWILDKEAAALLQ